MIEVKSSQVMVYLVAFIAALAGLLFGLDVGVISGALPFIGKQFAATELQKEWVVSSLLVGAVGGTLLSGVISRRYGRKRTILASAVIFALGSVMASLANSIGVLAGVRLFLGIAVGIASFTAPLYLSEMAPQRIRGRLISMYQLMITIGILLAFMSDAWLSYGEHWRVMLGILVVPSIVMFLGVLVLPESPRWLFLVNRKDDARQVLRKLRAGEDEVESELADIARMVEVRTGALTLLANPRFSKVILLGIVLQMMQQFTGINVMIYYAPKILENVGLESASEQMWGTVLIGLINVLATFVAIAFVDKLGRKPILAAGFAVMGLSMGVLGLMFMLGIGSHAHKVIAIVSLLVFIIGFAMSAGPIIWVLCSEIYPLAGRELGVTISTATNWICNAIIGATFLTLLTNLGSVGTFFLFGVLNILFIFIMLAFTPETKGVSLEHIEENLMAGKPLRQIGN